MRPRLHYLTKEEVQPEELGVLNYILEEEYNSKNSNGCQMRLQKKRKILEAINPPDSLWCHVEVNGENSETVLRTLKKLSKAIPRLTWILYGENKIFNGEIQIKAGKILSERKEVESRKIYL